MIFHLIVVGLCFWDVVVTSIVLQGDNIELYEVHDGASIVFSAKRELLGEHNASWTEV